ncbi:MAG: hypothetical protein ACI9MR_003587, partial [Myxococcota bacterium]
MATKPYGDDLEYLGAALDVLRLAGRRRILEREASGLIPRDPVAVYTDAEPDPEELRKAYDAAVKAHAARLGNTKEKPAALKLQETFGLSDFERDVLLLALAPAIDGSFNQMYGRVKGSSYRAPLDIDVALTLLVDDFGARVQSRRSFTSNGALLKSNLLLLSRGGGGTGDSFLALEITLPARLVSLLLGQTGEDETLQSFSRLIEPTETLDRVILPMDDKVRIVELVAYHDHYLAALDAWGLKEAIPYGRGVTMLFSGPPGTGKTLTARAVANHLGRRLLQVDSARLGGQASQFEANLENLLREARLQNAVLFFDECEGLFSAQNRFGGPLPVLLQALEQFEGVCILATNLPKTLDHALDRRILYRVAFQPPSPSMREAIWKVHLPEALPLADDVDVGYLARRFEFTGGYIKNAVLLAASAAAGRSATGRGEAVVTQQDFVQSCYSQLRHRLDDLATNEIADLRLSDVILP